MKRILTILSCVLVLLLCVTCQENNIFLGDAPVQPETPSGEEDAEAFIESLAEDLVDVMSEVDVLIEGCNSMDDVAQRLATMNQIEGVEDVYISSDYLFVKSNGVNLSWSFYEETDEDADDELIDESLQACYNVIHKSDANNDEEHEILYKGISKEKLKVCIANQQAEDYERESYKEGYKKLEDNFKECGFDVTLLEGKKVSVEWFLNSIFDYNIIFLVAHGIANEKDETFIQITGDEILGETDEERNEHIKAHYRYFYQKLLDDSKKVPAVSECRDYIGFLTVKGMKVANDKERDVTYVMLSENIIPFLKGRFDNAVIFNTSCTSMYNHNFAKKLIDKGAVAYLGYNWNNSAGKEAGPEFFKNMLKGMTVKQAFDKLPYGYRVNNYKGVDAILEYEGNDNVCIVHPEAINGSAYVDGATVVLKGRAKDTNSLMKCEAAFCYSENAGDFKLGMQGVDSTYWKPFDGDWKNDVEFSVECKNLKASTKYYYRAVVKTEGNYFYSEVKSFETEESYSEFVDLGLSVLWARCNVGANRPEESGGYYAWGEKTEKDSYSMDSYSYYKYHEPDSENWFGWCEVLKYCLDSDNGNVDGLTTLQESDDVAMDSSEKIRMPSKAEFEELVKQCVWKRDSINGVWGYKVIGPNKNSIFLPASGKKEYTSLNYAVTRGIYWSNELDMEYVWPATCPSSYSAYTLEFSTGWIKDRNDYVDYGKREEKCSSAGREYGCTVRAVKEKQQ